MEKGYALITGASGGIGRQLAYHFAEDGYSLVLVARSKEKLEELKKELENNYSISVLISIKDLSKQEEALKLYDEIKQQRITVQFLVNNAGFGLYGTFIETSWAEEADMIDLNIKTLTYLTKLFLPEMVERNEGRILNIASVASFLPGPLMAVYYATKAYVLSFTEALENELKDTNITISALCPGPTKTGFSDRANLSSSKLFESGALHVEDVAKVGYEQFMRGKTIIIPGAKFKVATMLPRFFPRKLITKVVRSIQEVK
ncbi:SDR family oxidoreductase [Priestia flexa]|uniref:SDR family NAD(P)-dependent oxidoreductase n=1 Tax=Priestia flexa TaxID=86664 RepID=UPI001A8F8E39|nr:SDR family oxidoreductase [Priestia flexa]MBN8434199.1 SDR family oxidoreductase [Priestia flexa]MCA0967017.1 SDR family oxidoreductase [Priestia flexa]